MIIELRDRGDYGPMWFYTVEVGGGYTSGWATSKEEATRLAYACAPNATAPLDPRKEHARGVGEERARVVKIITTAHGKTVSKQTQLILESLLRQVNS